MKIKRNDVVKCNLAKILINKVAEHLVNTGEVLNITAFEKDMASYCGIHIQSVRQLKVGILSSCSLPVAIKMAEFLDVKVEDLFYVVG